MRRISGIAGTLTLALAIMACGADRPPRAEAPPAPSAGDHAGSPDAPPSSAAPRSDLGEFRVVDMLAELPAGMLQEGQRFTVYAGDLTRATELAGVERPASLPEAPTWVSGFNGVVDEGTPKVFVPLDVPLGSMSPAQMVQDDLGWSVADVDRFVSFSSAAYPSTTVAAGNFRGKTLAALPEVNAGIRTAGEGADLDDDLADGTPARPHGVPLRMAVDDGRIIASIHTGAVQDWLAGSVPSLADSPPLAGMAEMLDRADAYSALIQSATPVGAEPDVDLARIGLTREDMPQFDAYAIGWAVTDDQPEMTAVYHVPAGVDVGATRSRIAARWAGTDAFGRPISTKFNVGGVTVQGRNVVVRFMPLAETSPAWLFSLVEASKYLPLLSR